LIKLKVKKGDTIQVHYTGTFEDGKVFDSSEGKPPLEFKVGEGSVIKGFDDAVIGMDIEDEKEISIKPEEAYGKREEKLVQEIPKAAFGEKASQLKPGAILGLKDPSGRTINAVVSSIGSDKVTLDLNHPLAGRSLKFKLKIISIK
jgi:peptidylprolyl isomerase